MIIGIGIDLIDLDRIRNSLQQSGDRFAHRILCDDERQIFQQRGGADSARGVQFLATRFAAKEAFSKAWGTGIGGAVSFHDLSVVNDEAGKPLVRAHGGLHEALTQQGLSVWVSLSDTATQAIAQVVIERTDARVDAAGPMPAVTASESGTLSPSNHP